MVWGGHLLKVVGDQPPNFHQQFPIFIGDGDPPDPSIGSLIEMIL